MRCFDERHQLARIRRRCNVKRQCARTAYLRSLGAQCCRVRCCGVNWVPRPRAPAATTKAVLARRHSVREREPQHTYRRRAACGDGNVSTRYLTLGRGRSRRDANCCPPGAPGADHCWGCSWPRNSLELLRQPGRQPQLSPGGRPGTRTVTPAAPYSRSAPGRLADAVVRDLVDWGGRGRRGRGLPSARRREHVREFWRGHPAQYGYRYGPYGDRQPTEPSSINELAQRLPMKSMQTVNPCSRRFAFRNALAPCGGHRQPRGAVLRSISQAYTRQELREVP